MGWTDKGIGPNVLTKTTINIIFPEKPSEDEGDPDLFYWAVAVNRRTRKMDVIRARRHQVADALGLRAAQPAVGALTAEQSAAYDKVDRVLRSVLMDDDYAEYSAALDIIATPPAQVEQPALTDEQIDAIQQQYMRTYDPASAAGGRVFARMIERALTRKASHD
jgi:hypothetical protein